MIAIGPLALALERLFAILGIIAFLAAANWIGRRRGVDCDTAAWRALLAGLVAARAGFVAQNWHAFAIEPATILYVWQGGFSPLPGLVTAAIVLGVSLRRSRALAPLTLVFAGCVAVTSGATAAALASAQRPLPQGIVLSRWTAERACSTIAGASRSSSISGQPGARRASVKCR